MKKPNLYYNISNGENCADIFIYGSIGFDWYTGSENTASQFVRDFSALEEKYSRINVHINSPGGNVHEGIPISNKIRSSKADVHTYVDGIAYSMAAIIAISAKNVHMASNALLMLHNASTIEAGDAKVFRATADNLDRYDLALAQTVSDKLGEENKVIMDKFFDYQAHFFTAAEAKEAKLCDFIEDYTAEKVPANAKTASKKELFAFYENLSEDHEEKFMNKLASKITSLFSPIQNNQIKPTEMNFENAISILKKEKPSAEEISSVVAHIEKFNGANEKFTNEEVQAKVSEALKQVQDQSTQKDTEIKNLQDRVAELEKLTPDTKTPKRADNADPSNDDDPNAEFQTSVDAELKKLQQA
jgi:ATP-dependent protease ClpP protease subunit